MKKSIIISIITIAVVATAFWCIQEVLVCPINALRDCQLTTELSDKTHERLHLSALIDGGAGCDSISTEVASRENMIIKIHCFPGRSPKIDYSFDVPSTINNIYYGYGNNLIWTRHDGVIKSGLNP